MNYADLIELEWYFNSAESAIGLQSNFGAMRQALLNGGVSSTSKPDSMSDARMDAVIRARDVQRRMQRMPPRMQDILYSVFQNRQWPTELWSVYDRSLGCLPFCRSANEEFEKDTSHINDDSFYPWLSGVCIRKETERLMRMKVEADALFVSVLDAFGKTET